jgi:hypothetical protein
VSLEATGSGGEQIGKGKEDRQGHKESGGAPRFTPDNGHAVAGVRVRPAIEPELHDVAFAGGTCEMQRGCTVALGVDVGTALDEARHEVPHAGPRDPRQVRWVTEGRIWSVHVRVEVSQHSQFGTAASLSRGFAC